MMAKNSKLERTHGYLFQLRTEKRELYAPIFVVETYLVITLLLFMFGPVKWIIPNQIKVFVYAIINFLALWLGYYVKICKGRRSQGIIRSYGLGKFNGPTRRYFVISAIFNIFSLPLLSIFFVGSISVANLMNPADPYFLRMQGIVGQYQLPVRLITWLWVLDYFCYPIGLLYWEKMSWSLRGMFLLSTLMTILYWLNQGTMKGLGDLIVITIPVFLIREIYKKRGDVGGSLSNKKLTVSQSIKKRKVLALSLVLISLMIILMGWILEGRMSYIYGPNYEYSLRSSLTRGFISSENRYQWLEKRIGRELSMGVYSTCSYVSHGYSGLAYCLEMPFEWTYGLGASRALSEYAEKYLKIDVRSKTYLVRNESTSGWRADTLWSTVFPWLAGDVSFYGVPIIMFLIGIAFAASWAKIIRKIDALTLVLICQLFIFGIFIPANNQIVQSPQSFFGFVGLIFLCSRSWILKRGIGRVK